MAPTAFWTFFVVNLVPMFYFVHMIVSSFACIITVNDGTFDASLLRLLEAHIWGQPLSFNWDQLWAVCAAHSPTYDGFLLPFGGRKGLGL